MSSPSPEVTREKVQGACPRCASEELARYQVMAEAGWQNVTKCQACLYSVERAPASRLGPITLLADLI